MLLIWTISGASENQARGPSSFWAKWIKKPSPLFHKMCVSAEAQMQRDEEGFALVQRAREKERRFLGTPAATNKAPRGAQKDAWGGGGVEDDDAATKSGDASSGGRSPRPGGGKKQAWGAAAPQQGDAAATNAPTSSRHQEVKNLMKLYTRNFIG